QLVPNVLKMHRSFVFLLSLCVDLVSIGPVCPVDPFPARPSWPCYPSYASCPFSDGPVGSDQHDGPVVPHADPQDPADPAGPADLAAPADLGFPVRPAGPVPGLQSPRPEAALDRDWEFRPRARALILTRPDTPDLRGG